MIVHVCSFSSFEFLMNHLSTGETAYAWISARFSLHIEKRPSFPGNVLVSSRDQPRLVQHDITRLEGHLVYFVK